MLQSVRDNLKGTIVSVIVILFFILPMVITGVGSSFLGSVAGTDAAVVDGRSITKKELSREIYMQKQRLLAQQGVDPSADYLKDENLAQPVLERLTRKAAVLAAAEKGGMAVSEKSINVAIVGQEEFKVDGKFSSQQYRSLLARVGLTPAAYKAATAEEMMLGQLNKGLELSSFVTEKEKSEIIAIINEKRSFFTVKIPADGLADSIEVTDAEIAAYYQANEAEFREPEKLSVDYIELSVNSIAATVTVDEADVRSQYEQEAESFDATPELTVAHILLEEDSSAKLTEVQAKLAAGDEFADVAKAYSDDAGSRDQGGELGVLVAGAFPEAFESAARELGEGEVSGPVKTDSGTHFIKVLKKDVPEVPSFESRKAAIERSLKVAKAEGIYLSEMEKLDELTFGAPDLSGAAKELGIEVKTTQPFQRNTGLGVAGNPEVRNAAFGDEVLIDNRNSQVIELAGNRALVVRKNTHSPEHIKPLEEVKEQVVSKLTESKLNDLLEEKAETFIAEAKSSEDLNALAESSGYAYAMFEDVSRSDPVSDPATRNTVFSMPLIEGETAFDARPVRDGSYQVVGVVKKSAGTADDMEPAQVAGLATQLSRENSRFEGSAFESEVVANADIKIH
ncbi:SurA N-terminal domain-containing protein [Teredinibacter turnerae]|uniref:SurA N-terminal domain-containing protein n=1 Tax=Teredinibacter turnerae TaxID=2426 RepID=UPI00048F82A1|nr:SurA N-terminal domain-containing protein [Teredinibacter turnerae]